MQRSDIEAIGELAADALAAGGTLVKEMHEGIAARPFGVLGPAAAPARVIHDGVEQAVYAGVRSGLRAVSKGAARVAAARKADDEAPPITEHPRGALALGAINGLWGNHLHERGHPLALDMCFRRDGERVELSPRGLRSAYPDATSRLVVFVHGLCETDEAWRLGGRPTYGERLHQELGITPLELRYNTGLRISRNGRELARMLDDVLDHWPVTVTDLVLVGHSMGGLVARSACHYGEQDSRAWTRAVRHVFCLGSPHLGADLEKGVNALGWALRRLPETRAIADVLNARSVGIKDLRYGSCLDEDWSDCDPDEFLRDRCGEVPFLPGAHYYFIGATLREGPIGTLLGDLLVRSPSASGRGNGKGRSIPFEVENGCELTGLTHFDLLNHPAVYEQLRAWITRTPRALPAAA